MKKRIFISLLIFFIISMSAPVNSIVSAHGVESVLMAPLYIGNGQIIPNQYIVVLKPGRSQASRFAAFTGVENNGGEIKYSYTKVLNGFAAEMTSEALKAMMENPDVAYIQADEAIKLPDEQVKIFTTVESGDEGNVVLPSAAQSPVVWGLDRIDQKNLPLNNTYSYAYNGSGVHVYVIDTGIRSTHSEFGGRASKDYDAVGDGQNGNDCNGHGTHVAGTIGGTVYGVAKGVRIHAIRVLDCNGSGSVSGVIAGINYVASNRVLPAVANVSLGGGYSKAMNDAVSSAINLGVTFVVAAGNSSDNACNYSPASNLSAITVGATTKTDVRSSFSNHGSCLDVFAPGTLITSAWNINDVDGAILSGTSMAAPHVTGVVALYLQENPSLDPAAIASMIDTNSTHDLVSDSLASPNKLLFSGSGALSGPSATVSPSSTSTKTSTPTRTATPTNTATRTATKTATLVVSATVTRTPTLTATPSNTATRTATKTATLVASATATRTPTITVSPSKTSTITATVTASETPVPSATYTPTPTVTASRTKIPTATQTITPVDSPPAATLISPAGGILQSTPLFVWNKVDSASFYYLWVEGPAGVILQEWYASGQASCGALRCQVMAGKTLDPGVYTWKIQTWNSRGYGPWSTPVVFSYGVPLSKTPTPLVTVTPTVTAILGSTITPTNTVAVAVTASPTATVVLVGTVTPTNTIVPTGTLTPTRTLTPQVGQVVLLEPVVDSDDIPSRPVFKWNKVAGAVYYYLYLTGPSGEVFSMWYSNVQAACNATVCSVSPPLSLGQGKYSWWIRPWSSAGLGPWGSGATFSR